MDNPIEHFAPSILINGRTYYPSAFEWLLGFAIAGCKWAEDAIPEAVRRHNEDEIQKTLGSDI